MIPEADENEILNRLDLFVMRAYRDQGDVRQVREQVVQEWRQKPELARLALSRFDGLSRISAEQDDRAVRTIADYWFEALFLPTMNLGQARDYFLAVQESMQLEVDDSVPPPSDRPLILQTLHHSCIFSILYVIIQYLVAGYDFRKFVLLHLRDPLDPRLEICKKLVEEVLGVEGAFIQLEGDWLANLRREMTDRSVFIYMGDMPPSLFRDRHRPGKTSSTIKLYAEPDIDIAVEGISTASILARRFRAGHHLLDFPTANTVRLRPCTGSPVELECPLTDWVFWPALRRWYEEIPQKPDLARAG